MPPAVTLNDGSLARIVPDSRYGRLNLHHQLGGNRRPCVDLRDSRRFVSGNVAYTLVMRFLRYTLATLCFAASVGGFAFWWVGLSVDSRFILPQYLQPNRLLLLECCAGVVVMTSADQIGLPVDAFQSIPHNSDVRLAALKSRIARDGQFGSVGRTLYVPLWYPALGAASLGAGLLLFDRRFTIRSTIITTSVVAIWLGIPLMFCN